MDKNTRGRKPGRPGKLMDKNTWGRKPGRPEKLMDTNTWGRKLGWPQKLMDKNTRGRKPGRPGGTAAPCTARPYGGFQWATGGILDSSVEPPLRGPRRVLNSERVSLPSILRRVYPGIGKAKLIGSCLPAGF